METIQTLSEYPSSDNQTSLTPSARQSQNGPATVPWYRTKLNGRIHRELHSRSDAKGWVQSGGYLALVIFTGGLSGVLAYWQMWGWFVVALFFHGTVSAFMINAVHELTHGTVFKTRFWNLFFARLFSWLSWMNHEVFTESHARHHRYTLHVPDDLEVVLPIKVVVRDFFLKGFIHPQGLFYVIRENVRLALGQYRGEWKNKLFPEKSLERQIPTNWSRIVLACHSLVLLISTVTGGWWFFVIVSMTPLYGSWFFFLMNNTQHIGLQDHVSDFRLCCRTFTVHPFLEFLYWHMNYHTEHHMYAAVPCYNLGKLHQAILHEMPPVCHGLLQTWIEIAYIQRRQKENPGYQHIYLLPSSAE